MVIKAGYETGEVDGAVKHTVRELSNKANIKGFRRGHVPRKTLELYIGKNAIYKEALEDLANRALEEIVSEYDIDMIAEPKCKFGDLTECSPLELEFTFEARPEVTLPDIASLTAEKVVFTVKDEDVEEGIRQLLESNARLEPLEDDRPAAADDIVATEYTSYSVRDDGSVKELERGKKNTLFLADLRRDIADSVAGHKPAEEFSFEIKLEDDYPDPKMAGKRVRYEMEILNFMKRVVPEATDETAAEISRGKYNTIGEMKAEIRRQLEDNAVRQSEATLEASALKALAAAAEVDVPDSMIERQYQSMRKEEDVSLQRNLRQSLDDYLKNNNLSVEEYDGDLRKRAAEIVRNTLVLDALAERDEISFTSDELNEEIIQMANRLRVNPQTLADTLSENKQEFTALAMRVRTKNTMKRLASLARVTEKTPEEYEREHKQEQEREREEEKSE
jgi:trigger factor